MNKKSQALGKKLRIPDGIAFLAKGYGGFETRGDES